MIFNSFRSFVAFIKQNCLRRKRSSSKKAQTVLEDDLYSLDGRQLKNLLEKNIYFDFFQLDSLTEEGGYDLRKSLKKAQLQAKENILSQLKGEDFKKPIVLICKTGESSKVFSRELRAKGFANVYFVRKGFHSLMEDF